MDKERIEGTGILFSGSMSNFIFATHKTCPAKELFEALRGQHIYVRYFQKDRIDNFLRITVGTKEEMQKFIDFFEGLSEVKVRRFYGSTGTLVFAESVTIYFTGRGSFYYFNDSDSGAQGRNPCGRSGVFKYPDLACNPNLSGREPDPNSVYPASDPSDFCMAAQDAPFRPLVEKAGEKSDEQK